MVRIVLRSGTQEFEWPDGSKYKGEWQDNKRHGRGQLL